MSVASKTPRHIALDILCRVERGAYLDRLLDAQREHIRDPDGDLLQHLVRGTLTYRARLDHILTPYLKKPLSRQHAKLRNLLRLGVYQLQYLDRVPPYAVVSESVIIARHILGNPVAKLVNAVLRGVAEDRKPVVFPDFDDDPVAYIALKTSHPQWLVARWIERYGIDETRALCEFDNAQPTLTIRPNALRTTPDALREQLALEGIGTEFVGSDLLSVSPVGHLFQSRAYCDGLFSVQGTGAAMVVPLLDPQPGEAVLDLCSAPGGKAIAMAERMKNRGFILATDLYPRRLEILKQNTHRLGVSCVYPLAADARYLAVNRLFDRVLVDAPCSSLGILNHHPDLRWRECDIHGLARLQRALIERAADYVCPGGVLVYSTCTLEPEENERVVEGFLSDHPGFRVTHPHLQLLPHQTGNDGVFAARLKRSV
jgi:16S rRNA (cytosine967-C5)-methyltransferase